MGYEELLASNVKMKKKFSELMAVFNKHKTSQQTALGGCPTSVIHIPGPRAVYPPKNPDYGVCTQVPIGTLGLQVCKFDLSASLQV